MIVTRRLSLCLLAAVILAGLARMAVAGETNVGSDGIGIQGYDPVAYFTEDRAVAGSPDFTAEHGGATYRFSSAAHWSAFIEDPEKYVPQYGGFCAYAVAHGATAPIDPQAFTVFEGKLFLNYSDHVRAQWRNDASVFISKADANWPELSGQ